jgi:pimeloyl-ACP methyl ester carboxylesterase
MLYPVLLLFLMPAANTGASPESIGYLLMDKSDLQITFETVNPGIHTLAADSDNVLVVKVQVSYKSGAGVPGAGVKLEVSNSTGISNSIGTFQPSEGVTDASGSFLSVYTPPSFVNLKLAANNTGLSAGDSGLADNNPQAPAGNSGLAVDNSKLATGSNTLTLKSHLAGTDKSSAFQIKLIPAPVVLIHGYQSSPDVFSGISEYLKQQGFAPISISYASGKGVASSATELSNFLQKKANEFESNGIQVRRFDLIAHSMGGLVARYYTCSDEYTSRRDVRKLIFISVPQKGSPFASLGLQYYNDNGIRDLTPGSALYASSFPSMINGGLNPSIQTGSLLGSFDEVVDAESASLAEWKIDTELFDLGDSNFTIDKLLTGELLQAANHKMILYNKKVYQRVQQMLESDIPYPATK